MSHNVIEFEVSKRVITGLLCVTVGALGYGVNQALADDDPSTQDITTGNIIMPYDGFLMSDSTAPTGAVRLRFELFEAPAGGAAPEWVEEQDVNVLQGRFSVGLGAVTQLNATLLDAQRLWLGITVLEDDGQGGVTEVALSGRQSIEPAPYAAWSAHAADVQVAGDLDVAGNALVAADLHVGGDVDVVGGNVDLDGHRRVEDQGTTMAVLGSSGSTLHVEGSGLRADGGMKAASRVTFGDDTSDEFTVSNILEQPNLNVATVTDATKAEGIREVQGGTGLGFRIGTAFSAMAISSSNTVRFGERLYVLGEVLNLSNSIRFNAIRTGSLDLNVNESDGFCFLSGMTLSHSGTSNPQPMLCHVVLENGVWHLQNKEAANTQLGNAFCSAQCVLY